MSIFTVVADEAGEAGQAVRAAMRTGNGVREACTAAADVWHRVEATDRAAGRMAEADRAHAAMLAFSLAAVDGMARAGLTAATAYATPTATRRRRSMSDYRGACGGLFGGAY